MADFYASYDSGAAAAGGSSVTIVGPLGQEPMADSIPVVIASDQSPIPVIPGSLTTVALYEVDFASDPLAEGDYFEIDVGTAATIKRMYIFNSSGAALTLATGAAASETDIAYIFPGGLSSPLDLTITAGVRLSIGNIDPNVDPAAAGFLYITALG